MAQDFVRPARGWLARAPRRRPCQAPVANSGAAARDRSSGRLPGPGDPLHPDRFSQKLAEAESIHPFRRYRQTRGKNGVIPPLWRRCKSEFRDLNACGGACAHCGGAFAALLIWAIRYFSGYPDNTNKVLAIIGTGRHNRFQVPKVMQTFRFAGSIEPANYHIAGGSRVLLLAVQSEPHIVLGHKAPMVIEPGVSIGPVRDGIAIQRGWHSLADRIGRRGGRRCKFGVVSHRQRRSCAYTVCVEPSGQDGPRKLTAGSEKKGRTEGLCRARQRGHWHRVESR